MVVQVVVRRGRVLVVVSAPTAAASRSSIGVGNRDTRQG